ncbi:uncharacterized protein (DUF2384 family) [Sphingobium sp. B11D3B]|uniref:MbcA/ParS/Xre antitoxin family protein n=1 Tax=Sphingobium sp. B11D3B TaxID=2940575 RepID=UPI002227FC22|nr:MbcA/ParS/Xre antitoxin family protein [Sphingobium sp. B11D3B]MCW2390063.1 uncharacterized protein (DUF2384 family) [Sphingobium sp. B11D3B]
MIAIEWGLTLQECRLVLGYPATSTYRVWKKRAQAGKEIVLSVDTLTRISALLGIYRAVRILFGEGETAAGWLRRPNDERVFGGNPPMSLVTAGTQDALMTARRFLDAACLGVYMSPPRVDVDFKPYEDDEIIFL